MGVAEVVKTFGDSRCGSKLLTSSATQNLNLDEAPGWPNSSSTSSSSAPLSLSERLKHDRTGLTLRRNINIDERIACICFLLGNVDRASRILRIAIQDRK